MAQFEIKTLPSFRTLLRGWRLLSVRKIIYAPHILTIREKRILFFLLFIFLLSGSIFFTRLYLRFTVPVPAVGSSYTEGMLSEPHNINPLYAATDGDRDIARLVYSSLLTYSTSGAIEPELAESYTISPDGKTYTVTLKKNAQWHDGKPVIADDVVFTVKTIQNPQYKSSLRANWQGVSVEKVDQYTVRFLLRVPYAPFIENLTTGIIPQHLWAAIDPEKAQLHELNLKPVGSGPYKFSDMSLAKDGSITQYNLVRNSHYYRPGPYISSLYFIFFNSEEEMYAAWQRGKIDGFGPFPAYRIAELDRERAQVETLAMPRIFGIFFNQKQSLVLGDISVRRAIAFALNKKEVAAAVLSGATPTDSILPLAYANTATGTEVYLFDPDRSKTLLEKAGWRDDSQDGIRKKIVRIKGKNKTVPLHFTLTTSNWPDLIAAAEKIKTMLRAVGIDVTVQKKGFNDLESSVIRPRNFEMLLFGQVYGYEPDPFPFWHSSQIKDPGLNVALYSNKKVDQILQDTRRLSNAALRAKKFEELQKLIAADIPAVFLYAQSYYYLLPTSLKGVGSAKISLPADRFNQINSWYIKTGRVFR